MSSYPDPHTGSQRDPATRRAHQGKPVGKMLLAGVVALAVIVAVVLLLI